MVGGVHGVNGQRVMLSVEQAWRPEIARAYEQRMRKIYYVQSNSYKKGKLMTARIGY